MHDRVRGTNPWPSGQTTFRGAPFKVHRTRLLPEVEGEAGVVLEAGPRGVVGTGAGAVELLRVQAPNKARQDAADWANGARLQVGEAFGD